MRRIVSLQPEGNRAPLRKAPAEWVRIILRQELNQLKREANHLNGKQDERELNQWELQRIAQLGEDVMRLLPLFAKIGD